MVLHAFIRGIIPSRYEPIEGLSLFLLLQVDGFLEQISHLLDLSHHLLVAWHHVVDYAAVLIHRDLSIHVTERNWPTYVPDSTYLIALRN